MKDAVLGTCISDTDEQKVVSSFCLFRDRFFGRSVVFADCHVERWRRVISALRTLDIVGGRLDCFLDAIRRSDSDQLRAANVRDSKQSPEPQTPRALTAVFPPCSSARAPRPN